MKDYYEIQQLTTFDGIESWDTLVSADGGVYTSKDFHEILELCNALEVKNKCRYRIIQTIQFVVGL